MMYKRNRFQIRIIYSLFLIDLEINEGKVTL